MKVIYNGQEFTTNYPGSYILLEDGTYLGTYLPNADLSILDADYLIEGDFAEFSDELALVIEAVQQEQKHLGRTIKRYEWNNRDSSELAGDTVTEQQVTDTVLMPTDWHFVGTDGQEISFDKSAETVKLNLDREWKRLCFNLPSDATNIVVKDGYRKKYPVFNCSSTQQLKEEMVRIITQQVENGCDYCEAWSSFAEVIYS